jgi:IclR family transcriptional regulator, acetate operon repressor
LPKPTVYRILNTLEESGILMRELDGKRYMPGERMAKLAGETLLRSPQRSARHAILEELVEQTGETCNLTMPNGSNVMYLDRVEAAWPLRVNLHAGSSVPLYASASGKLFLAHMPKRIRDRYIINAPLIKHTPKTLADLRSLESEFTKIRHDGYAVDDEEYLLGICCLAVPVLNDAEQVVAAIAVHGPSTRVNFPDALVHIDALRNAADAISNTLDWG